MPQMLPLAVALFYASVLFLFASWADGDSHPELKSRLRPPAYALALAVYCTSWTYYGAVGSALAGGWSYLPIYLGPILVFIFGHGFLRRLIDAVKADGANSISEFIGGRFSNSQGVAALVTTLALLGSIPYLALQLRSLGTTYALIAGTQVRPITIGLAATMLALFAMIYGTRRYEPGSRNDAILFAVSFESIFKIGALVFAGIIALILLFNAPVGVGADGWSHLAANFAPSRIGIDFFVITSLSMAAIVCLPRQFYVTVIEARSSADISAARWPFVAYMLVTLLIVLPISAVGLTLLPGDDRPDLFVLQLPLSHGWTVAALLIFLGGFSAATAMVLVETIALSTMISNDLIAPFLVRSNRFSGEGDLGQALLTTRRAAIGCIMGAAVAWALGIGDNQRLASIGLVAFAAMAQFSPALVLAVMGGNRDALAAKAGLGAGLVVWIYTLALPQLASAEILDWLEQTPLNPHALFGVDGLSPISHGTFWSLGVNIAAFVLTTMRRVQPGAFPALLRTPSSGAAAVSNITELKALVARFVGPEITAEAFAGVGKSKTVDRSDRRKAERLIASVVGVPSARAVVSSALYGSNLTHEEVARILDDTGQSLRFSKGLLASILENIDQGVSVVDRQLNLVAWNGRYLELFDYPPGMVRVGAPVADLIRYNAERGECGPGEVEAHIERRLNHMRHGQPHSFKRVRPDGRILKTVGGPMPSGGYVMSFTDVTVEEQALAALEMARTELEMRIEERTSELRAANVALAEADEDKTRFLAAASHDLLQPLHAARLFSAALGRDLVGAPVELLGKLDRSILSAETLLRSLLDISKLDAGGVSPEAQPLRLRGMLVELVETMRPLAVEKGLEIRIGPGDASVETDPGLLRSIVQNFLSNAIRYTQSGGVIVGVRHRGSRARIDVIDTGPGIAEEKHKVIFREFERLPNASEGGIGLGLAIVERTARLLDGRISLRSREGRGSRFSIALPLGRPSLAAPSPVPPEQGYSATPLSILVADDDPTNCEALQGWLRRLGHDVKSVTSPAAAMSCQELFDVALIDFNLGGDMDGIELIEALRLNSPTTHFALVTAARESSYAARAQALGISVMRKPLSPLTLELWLRQIETKSAAE
ncbi:hybrid sensor histidine kinase/response regulator [Sphingobium subterraneum]|uniref:histidine kinase n=1 Tax=Sphingobium subterraneum TaxID=627688 RepID=A0A841J3B9_9SPHN|nr:PAS-domain containing protein [Sphingobium subterraneum]MBB6125274.1 signal transduction histidine kinase/Na+/proline symporter [Sphingobium subterraneum]